MAKTLKPFAPAAGEPGSAITWTQYALDGQNVERTGTIIDRAPSVDGAVVTWWVQPDESLPADMYPIIAVGKATRSLTAHGRYIDGAGDQFASKGAMFASWYAGSPTGGLVATAVRKVYEHRAA